EQSCETAGSSTTVSWTLALHDALPSSDDGPARLRGRARRSADDPVAVAPEQGRGQRRRPDAGQRRHLVPPPLVAHDGPAAVPHRDRKSTRLNSSHVKSSYAVFCLKKKR